MGGCFGAAGTNESARGPEFHDHKLTGLPGTVATVAYAKNGAIKPRQIVPSPWSLADKTS